MKDFLGNEIEVGDRFFRSTPPLLGTVLEIHSKHIVLSCEPWKSRRYVPECHTVIVSTTKCRAPKDGICLNKVKDKI